LRIGKVRKVRLICGPHQVIRLVCLSMLAAGVIATAMAIVGFRLNMTNLVLGGIFVLVVGILAFHVQLALRELRGRSESIEQAATKAEEHYIDVLGRIVKYVEARNKYTEGHSERVGAMAAKVGAELGFDREMCKSLSLAGELHDIGMLAIPERIIQRRSELGVDAFRCVMEHPEVAFEVLKPLKSLEAMLPAIRHHHERMNGTGYPTGLAEEDIPIEARILAVTDSYDAMTHDRPNRSAMTPLSAMMELRRCTPAGYDPDCVEALGKVMNLPCLEEVANLSGMEIT